MMTLTRWAVSPSKSVLVVTAAALTGVLAHAIWESAWPGAAYLPLAFGGLLPLAVVAWRRPVPRLLVLSVSALLLSLWRYEAALAGLPPVLDWSAKATTFRGHLAQPARQTIQGTVLTLDRVLFVQGDALVPVTGRFRLWIQMPAEVAYASTVSWSCRPNPSVPAEDQAYWLEAVVAECGIRDPPEQLAPPDRSLGPVQRFRDLLRRQAGRLWPEPESSFMLGLLLGDRDGIPPRMTANFRETGTSHILAVSGYNISKVVGLAMLLAALVRIRRRRAAWLAGLAILGFAAMVGGQASIIRAALMGCFGLLAILLARQSGGGGALWLTAAVMLVVSPLALSHDLGFQLSFAAVWGLGAYGPRLAELFWFLPEPLGLRQSAAETVAATLATMPVILFAFDRLPLVGPLVNVVILPMIPLSMLIGAVALLIGAASTAVALPVAWIGFAVLRVVEAVVNWSADLGFPAVEGDFGLAAAVLMSACLIALAWAWSRPRPSPNQP